MTVCISLGSSRHSSYQVDSKVGAPIHLPARIRPDALLLGNFQFKITESLTMSYCGCLVLQLGIKTRLQDFHILFNLQNGEQTLPWLIHNVLNLHINSFLPPSQHSFKPTQLFSVGNLLYWQVHSHHLPFRHSLLLHALDITGTHTHTHNYIIWIYIHMYYVL